MFKIKITILFDAIDEFESINDACVACICTFSSARCDMYDEYDCLFV